MSGDDLEQRLAAARARKAERDAAEAPKRERAQQERELAQLERDEAVSEASGALGALGRDILRVDVDHADGTPVGAVIVRAPKVASWRGYLVQRDTVKGMERDALDDKMWRACLAWPELAKVETLIAGQPFLRERLMNAIAQLAGVRDEVVSGKS